METLRVLPAFAGGEPAVCFGPGLGSSLAQLGKGRFPPCPGPGCLRGSKALRGELASSPHCLHLLHVEYHFHCSGSESVLAVCTWTSVSRENQGKL